MKIKKYLPGDFVTLEEAITPGDNGYAENPAAHTVRILSHHKVTDETGAHKVTRVSALLWDGYMEIPSDTPVKYVIGRS